MSVQPILPKRRNRSNPLQRRLRVFSPTGDGGRRGATDVDGSLGWWTACRSASARSLKPQSIVARGWWTASGAARGRCWWTALGATGPSNGGRISQRWRGRRTTIVKEDGVGRAWACRRGWWGQRTAPGAAEAGGTARLETTPVAAHGHYCTSGDSEET